MQSPCKPVPSSGFSCTCICITNHFFSLTDTAASASAILQSSLTNEVLARSCNSQLVLKVLLSLSMVIA
jgi:hypothetical protein